PERGERSFPRLGAALSTNFRKYRGHVVVAAAGIVVRVVAPLLGDKTRDPAVVVVDPEGRFAVSLISGHLGGANDLARAVAQVLCGAPVITTGTDLAGKPAVELAAVELGLGIENFEALSGVSRAVLEGRPVPVHDPGGWFRPVLVQWPDSFRRLEGPPDPADPWPLVFVGPEVQDFPASWLVVRPPCLALGIGCNRGTGTPELEGLIKKVFGDLGLSRASIGRVATLEAKGDEPGLRGLAEGLGLELTLFPAEELARVNVPNPSAVVKKHMGVTSVCEAAALLAAPGGRLLAGKQKSRNATLAVALIVSK
ncbi:MAG: cobalamin biosynthesis protein, partial [Thermodesulfobacteriota bacterium]